MQKGTANPETEHEDPPPIHRDEKATLGAQKLDEKSW
jgi:hypothetical protein